MEMHYAFSIASNQIVRIKNLTIVDESPPVCPVDSPPQRLLRWLVRVIQVGHSPRGISQAFGEISVWYPTRRTSWRRMSAWSLEPGLGAPLRGKRLGSTRGNTGHPIGPSRGPSAVRWRHVCDPLHGLAIRQSLIATEPRGTEMAILIKIHKFLCVVTTFIDSTQRIETVN